MNCHIWKYKRESIYESTRDKAHARVFELWDETAVFNYEITILCEKVTNEQTRFTVLYE